MALDFKDELIPLAYEYFLNVVEFGSDNDEEGLFGSKEGKDSN
jgi:hypothetical protein